MTSSNYLKITDPNYHGWFSKKFGLNKNQIEALKSGDFIRSFQTGIDLDVIKAFRRHENFALL